MKTKKKGCLSIAVKVVIVTSMLLSLTGLAIFAVGYGSAKNSFFEFCRMISETLGMRHLDHYDYEKVTESAETLKETGEVGRWYPEMREGITGMDDFVWISYVRILAVDKNNLLELASTLDDGSGKGAVYPSVPYAIRSLEADPGELPEEDLSQECSYMLIRNDQGEIGGFLEFGMEKNIMQTYTLAFLQWSVLTVLIVLGFGILLMVIILGQIAVHPLAMITNGVRGFSDGVRRYTKEDVLSLPIRSGDEIGELYTEIRSMQERIVDYTDQVERITAEKEHLLGQLEMAVRLKFNLMPIVFPAFPEEETIDLYADIVPAERIGGDFYDFFRLDREHIAVVIANFFDGGTAAALFMVAFKIVLRHFADLGLSPKEVIGAVNNRLCDDNRDDLTLSCWYGVYETTTGRVTAVNAGHETPYIITKEGVTKPREDATDWIIGMAGGFSYCEYTFTLSEGDMLFIYTDGVTEAADEEGRVFGEDRLREILAETKTPMEAVGRVQEAVAQFIGETRPKNDITELALLRKPEVCP